MVSFASAIDSPLCEDRPKPSREAASSVEIAEQRSPLFAPRLSAEERSVREESWTAARAVFDRDPASVDAVLALARADMALGRVGDALEILTRAQEGKPDDPRLARPVLWSPRWRILQPRTRRVRRQLTRSPVTIQSVQQFGPVPSELRVCHEHPVFTTRPPCTKSIDRTSTSRCPGDGFGG